MKKIQILGTGCSKCSDLFANAKAAVGDSTDYEIEKVTDITKIMEAGVMVTPALMIDGVVVSSGKILSPQEIKEHLKLGADEGCCSDKNVCDINCSPDNGGCDCGGCC